jgi:predicted HTH transcriptional regulator
VENMGTGIGKIKTLLKKAKAPEPRFEFGEFVTIIFPRPGKFLNKSKQQGSEKVSEKMSEKVSEKASEKEAYW